MISKCTKGVGIRDYSSGGRRGEKNRRTVITSLRLVFTEHVVPATQAFDWSLDNRIMLICVDNGFNLSCRHWQVDVSIKSMLSYHKAHLAQRHEGFLVFWLGKCFLVPILFRGMAQKYYKITVSQGDICKRVINAKCVWHVFHHQQSFLINEWWKAWNSCHASWTRAAMMLLQSLYFSHFLPNRPCPLSSFDTHARWQPVTQDAQSRRSYEKKEDCEQSKTLLKN